MSTKVGDIFVRANLDDKKYRKGLSNLDKWTGGIGKSIAKKLTFAGAIAGLGVFAKKATEAGASLNAMGTIIDASLPNMTKQVEEFSKSAGAMFGLSETQAKGFVGKFASMASAMGYTEEQAYKMSTALTGLAGDVASYYHISSDDAYAKLGAVFTGETESLKQLGVVMTQSALDQFALQQGIGKTTKDMTEAEKTTLRFGFVLNSLKLTVGDFSKYSNTWSGSLAILRLNWSNFMATMGQGIINILLPLMQVLAKISALLTTIGQKFLAWTQRLKGIKKDTNNAFGKQTQKQLNNTSTGLGNVGSGLDTTGTNAKKAKKEVQKLKRELLGFDKITKLTKQDANTGTSGNSNLNGVDVGSVTGDTSWLDTFYDQYEGWLGNIQKKWNDTWGSMTLPKPLQDALANLKTAFSGLFETLSTAGQWAMDNIIAPMWEYFEDKALPISIETLANAITLINNAFKVLGEILEPALNLLKPFIKIWADWQLDKLNLIGEAFGKLANMLVDTKAGVENLKTAWENIKTWFTEQTANINIGDFVSEKITAIKAKWEEFKAFLAKGITPTVSLDDQFSGIAEKIKGLWDGIKQSFYNKNGKVQDIKAKVKLSLENKFTKAYKKIKKSWEYLANFGTKRATLEIGFRNLLTKAWNDLARPINNALDSSWIPKKVKDILPRMPILAQGGYVKANTPQLAMIGDNRHEGEIVAPESKLRAMAQEVSQGSNSEVVRLLSAILTAVQSQDTNVFLDGEQIKNNVVRRINNHTRATGQLEIIV